MNALVMATPYMDLVKAGKVLQEQHEQLVVASLKNAHTLTIGDQSIQAVNCISMLTSEVCNRLAKVSPIGMGASYLIIGDKVAFSLRGVGDVDVTRICGIYGGGGHKLAGGFSVPLKTFFTFFDKD